MLRRNLPPQLVQHFNWALIMLHHGTGLQPLNLVMTLVPFLVSSIVVGVRVWKKAHKRSFDAGMVNCRLAASLLTYTSDDLLIVILLQITPDQIGPIIRRRFYNAIKTVRICSLYKLDFPVYIRRTLPRLPLLYTTISRLDNPNFNKL